VRHEGNRYVLRIGNTTTGSKGSPVLVSLGEKQGTIVDPQLSLTRIAYTTVANPRADFGRRTLHVRTLRTGHDRVIYQARSGGANFANITRSSWNDSGSLLFFARTNTGSGQGNRYIRWSAETGKLSYAKGTSRAQSTSWIDRDTGLHVALGYGEGICEDGPDAPPACRLTETGPLSFSAKP